jgi:transcriptional regulator with XRE-family HTH domain
LAAKAGISISYMGYIERAEKAITVVILEKIAKVLNVPAGLLMERDAHLHIK